MDLQQQFHDCVGRKRAHDASLRAESHRIAMAHPIKFAPPAAVEPVFKRSSSGEWHAVFGTAEQQEPATQHAAEEQETVTKKARTIALEALPAPLKRADLDAAYAQLPAGAEVAIEASINMWREKRLGLSEVMATVKSFESQSPVLARALLPLSIKEPTAPIECEVATPEQMRELAALYTQWVRV
jgi:hypothetical protein